MSKGKSLGVTKVTFGRRKGGKAVKSKSPKAKNVSKYRGQGR